MKVIEKIEIHRYRSISDVYIETNDITIFSGINNSGKSNILKALNLFFNKKSSFDQNFDFEKDYNKAFTGQAGGKRAIKITLYFRNQGTAALKSLFSISRTFQLGQEDPTLEYWSENESVQKSIEKEDGNITRQFTRFLNKMEYFYIPAVRGKDFVHNLFLHFEKLIEHDTGHDFKDKMEGLSDVLRKTSQDLSADFEKFIGLPTQANLSSKVTDILGTVEVNVKTGIQVIRKDKSREDVFVNLFSSGDGILMSYLAYFLAHICKKISNKIFIWGFEEPENSLEYSKVQKIARDFLNEFKKNGQIFITTHSPAFIKLRNEQGVGFFRVYINSDDIKDIKQSSLVKPIQEIKERYLTLFNNGDIDTPEFEKLEKELNFVEIAEEIENAVKELHKTENFLIETKNKFQREYEQILMSRPDKIFICEDSDRKIIEFWEHILMIYDLKDIKIMPSHGCTNTFIENGVRYQRNLDNNYNPKIFRQIDRDGLSNDQINFINNRIFENISNGLDYKYQFIPVNEVENFAVLLSNQFSSVFWETHRIELEDKFNICALSTCQHLVSIFKGEKLFNIHGDATVTQPMKDFARTNWKKYFPGKDICTKVPNFNAIVVLKSLKQEELPQELKDYMICIKQFFETGKA